VSSVIQLAAVLRPEVVDVTGPAHEFDKHANLVPDSPCFVFWRQHHQVSGRESLLGSGALAHVTGTGGTTALAFAIIRAGEQCWTHVLTLVSFAVDGVARRRSAYRWSGALADHEFGGNEGNAGLSGVGADLLEKLSTHLVPSSVKL
jgi:hypothetical protein